MEMAAEGVLDFRPRTLPCRWIRLFPEAFFWVKVLPADRPKYQNTMPPFGSVYKDADIASLINYLRANFAPNAPKVTPEEVAAQRAKL